MSEVPLYLIVDAVCVLDDLEERRPHLFEMNHLALISGFRTQLHRVRIQLCFQGFGFSSLKCTTPPYFRGVGFRGPLSSQEATPEIVFGFRAPSSLPPP